MSAVSTAPCVFLQLPSHALPTMGSTNGIQRAEIQRNCWHREQDQQDRRGIPTLFPFFSRVGYYSFFSVEFLIVFSKSYVIINLINISVYIFI